jgi:AbrB family looped-hinge helix DNA binding protein
MRIGERGQVTIPKEIRDRFGLGPETEVEFHVRNGAIVLKKAPKNFEANEIRENPSRKRSMNPDGSAAAVRRLEISLGPGDSLQPSLELALIPGGCAPCA